MLSTFVIKPPNIIHSHSVIKELNEVVSCVYSRFSIEGWGDISDTASHEFSNELCGQLLDGSFIDQNGRGEIPRSTFINIAKRYKTDYPEWITCEFVAILLRQNNLVLHWVGDVHGIVKASDVTLAIVNPHVIVRGAASGAQKNMRLVTNSLNLCSACFVETTTLTLPLVGARLFAYIGSTLVREDVESSLRNLNNSGDVIRHGCVSFAETQGACIVC